MLSRLRSLARALRTELDAYRRIAQHPRTPWLSKVLLGTAVGYICLPFDLIPDWIPVIGQLDDLVVVPLLLLLALRLVPPDVVAECRSQAAQNAAAGVPDRDQAR